MNKLTVLAFAILFFSACEENMPVIPEFVASGNRKVLIEEVTGVGCVNCPQGSATIEGFLGLYPNNLIAVSIHTGEFARPYTRSKYDFRTTQGDKLTTDIFGEEPFAYPAAVVNRLVFPGQTSYYTGQLEWAAYIQSEIGKSAVLEVSIDKLYNPVTRQLDVTVDLVPFQDLNEDLRISVLITESGIEDYQLLPAPDGWVSNYSHKHVLRTMLTSHLGDAIGQALKTGIEVEKKFSYTLPVDWKSEKCKVVAFVHRTGTSKEVLQAEEAPVGN